VRLLAAGYVLESALLPVRAGRFEGAIELSPREFHAGVFTLQFAWGRTLSSRGAYESYLAGGGSPLDGEFRREVGVFLGTVEEARRQEEEARE
jgi:hypothetical protein